MAENQCPPLDTTGAGSWEPRTGGESSMLLSHDGDFCSEIVSATAGKSKSSDNYQVTLTLIVQDEDNKGKKLMSYVPYTGLDSGNPPRPNAHRLFEVLDASGTTKEKFKNLEAVRQVPIETICQALVGRKLHHTARAEKYDKTGVWSSKLGFFLSKERYETNKAIGAHRIVLPDEARGWAANRSGGTSASTSANGAGTSSGSGAPSTSKAAADLL